MRYRVMLRRIARTCALASFALWTACGSREPGPAASPPDAGAAARARPADAAPGRAAARNGAAVSLEDLLARAAPTREELARVAAALRSDTPTDPGQDIDAARAEKLADLGERRMALLASFLTDRDLGASAADAMLSIDRDRAAPYLFASMPRSDRNVQFRTFGRFTDAIQNRESVCCLTEMHAAAVRCLDADTPADAAERAILAVGLSGSPADFPLLARFVDTGAVDHWPAQLSRAATAALARLGSEAHLRQIERELAAPVPARIDSAGSRRIAAAIDTAAFSGKSRFLPLLCRHLGDPFPRDFSDDIPPMPAPQAARAIDRIANHAPLRGASADIDRARTSCAAHVRGADAPREPAPR